MPKLNRDSTDNAAWQAAHQWRARAANTQPSGLVGTLKLLMVWLVVGTFMVGAFVFGLFFMLVGAALMPFMRHKMKKRMDQMRAERAQDIGSGSTTTEDSAASNEAHATLEGSYEVKDRQ